MAFPLARNRRILFFLGFFFVWIAFMYLVNLFYLHWIPSKSPIFLGGDQFLQGTSGGSRKKVGFDGGEEKQSPPGKFHCEKANLLKPSVDIQLEDLWSELYGSEKEGASDPPGLEVWNSEKYDEHSARKEERLKVFVLPHSHVDPGWLKTVNEYTPDTNNMLNNMLEYMPAHPKMRFTWMEMTFFEKWWRGISDEKKVLTKKLIGEGRFQITSGSWVMSDEASPYFWASIDNIVEGHQFLKRELGLTPSVMWSNDPFGYGPTIPYLFKLANISRLVIQRVNSAVKTQLGKRKAMDFYFRQFFDSPGRFDSQVHVLPLVHYDVPHSCGPDSSVCCRFDFKRITNWGCDSGLVEPITEKNVAVRAKELIQQYWLLSRMYRSNVVLTMLGDDFRYDAITEWSQQHDNYMRLMEYIEKKPEWNIEVRFGTFDEFFSAFRERTNREKSQTTKDNDEEGTILDLPVLSGDFFPYNDVYDNYWTGYFSTRPFYKRQDRVVQAMIRAADIASSLVHFNGLDQKSKSLSSSWSGKLSNAHRNLALFQHHDAITGTSKWKVVADYGERLRESLVSAADVVGEAVSILTGGRGSETAWSMEMPHYDSGPDYRLIQFKAVGQQTVLWAFNTLPYWRSEILRFRVLLAEPSASGSDCLQVTDANGNPVKSQLNPIFNITGVDENMPDLELLFEAKMPPLAAVSFHLRQVSIEKSGGKAKCAELARVFVGGEEAGKMKFPKRFRVRPLVTEKGRNTVKLENDIITSYHNASSGYLQAIKRKTSYILPDTKIWKGGLEFWHYSDTASGAYLFSPRSDAQRWPYDPMVVVLLRGPVTEEIHSLADSIHHKEYLKKFPTAPEPDVQLYIENTLDVRGVDNVEMVMRIVNHDFDNDRQEFLTDSLGLQLIRRRYFVNRPINMNYYPIASQLVMQDEEQKRLTLLSGQPHGATSPAKGVLEVMLERRLTQDDSKGLGQGSLVRDNVPVTSYFRLVLEAGQFANSRTLTLRSQRSLQHLLYPPVTLVQSDDKKNEKHQQQQLVQFTPLSESFPCDTLLLNIRNLDWSADGSGSNGRRLLLLHRVITECTSISDHQCQGASHQDLPSHLAQLLKNPTSEECTLSGVQITSSSNQQQQRLEDYWKSKESLKPMEIRSVCIS